MEKGTVRRRPTTRDGTSRSTLAAKGEAQADCTQIARRPTNLKSSKRRIVAYLRVSTDNQELESQRLGIVSYSVAHNLQPLEFVEDTASGSIPVPDRRLGPLIDELNEGDVLLVSELSRLGRNMVEIMTVLKDLVDRRVHVFSVKENYQLDDSLNSKILSTVLCMVAEISRELTVARVKEGMLRAKRAGKKIGRPPGLPTRSKLDPNEADIRGYLAKGVSKASIAKIYDTTWQTVHSFVTKKGIQRPKQRRKII